MDPLEASVTVDVPPERGTDVTLEHLGWGRHGEEARQYRDGFEAAGAWPRALAGFAAAAAA